MPLWLRRTVFNLIREHYEKEKEEYDKINKKSSNNKNLSRPNIPSPHQQPSNYTARAPRK